MEVRGYKKIGGSKRPSEQIIHRNFPLGTPDIFGDMFGGVLFAVAVAIVVCSSSLITVVMEAMEMCRNTLFSIFFFCLLSFSSSAPAQKSGILHCLCPWWRICVVLVLAWTTAGGYVSRRKINPWSLIHWWIYCCITFTCRYLPMVQLSLLILFRKRWVVLIVYGDEGQNWMLR